jgi:hypothetical protein
MSAKTLLPLFLSIDTFIGYLVAAPLFRRWSHRVALAGCFGVSDMIACQVGSALVVPGIWNYLGNSVAADALIVYGAVRGAAAGLARARISPRLACALPLGLASFLMGLGGLAPGVWLARTGDTKRQLIAGTSMLAAGVAVAVF